MGPNLWPECSLEVFLPLIMGNCLYVCLLVWFVTINFIYPESMITWQSFCFPLTGTFKVKAGLAQMAKGGIIMDVTTAEEARVAENAGVSFNWLLGNLIKVFVQNCVRFFSSCVDLVLSLKG